MWWASVLSWPTRISFASLAIRSSLVEMSCEFNVSVIYPSNESVLRRAPLLGRVPRSGFPHVVAPTARSDLSTPDRLGVPCRLVLHTQSVETPSQVPGQPLRTCPALRSRRGQRLRPRRSALPVALRRILSPSTREEVSAPVHSCLRDPISRPARSLSTLRDHGRP